MTPQRAIGVMARAPIPGRCKERLLAAHEPGWVAGLYAAMLRDTLDGMLSVTADDYVVVAERVGDEETTARAMETLARHVPAPWEVVLPAASAPDARVEDALSTLFARGATYAVVASSDAPSIPIEPIDRALAGATPNDVIAGPTEDGGYYVLGMARLEPRLVRDIPWATPAVMETTRARCRELGLTLRELPAWYDVDAPSDVLTLLDEMRKHPERAPRTAQFLITR